MSTSAAGWRGLDAPVSGGVRRQREVARLQCKRRGFLVLCLVLLGVVVMASLMTGPVSIPSAKLLSAVAHGVGVDTGIEVNAGQRAVVTMIRLPRIFLGMLVGAALGMAGAALQGLFRNPLADPALIGVSSGAALAAVAVIVLGDRFFLPMFPEAAVPYLLPMAAFGGSLAATLVIYRLSLHEGRPVVATMLLAGVAVNALASAGMGFLIFLANDQQIRDLTFWSLGSLGGACWLSVWIVAPVMALAGFLLHRSARPLNALLLGESEAGHLGFDVWRTKWIVVTGAALSVGAGVAWTGMIAFVGLVVPHIIRLVVGPDHRFLLPVSGLLGAALLVGADLLARSVAVPAELPIGILTTAIGAPFFLWLLLRAKGSWQA